MKHFIVATHGYFSREIINSAALILGGGLDILSLCMCETTTGDDIRAALWQKLDSCAPDDDVIIMADVLGGGICTLCSEFMADPRVHIMAGVNMPMLLTVLGMQEFMDTKSLIEECLRSAREGVCYVNQLSSQAAGEDELL